MRQSLGEMQQLYFVHMTLKPGSHTSATIADCRIKEFNRLSIDFTAVVKLSVKHNTQCLSSCLRLVEEIEMNFIFLIGSIVVKDICWTLSVMLTDSSIDTNSIIQILYLSAGDCCRCMRTSLVSI